MTAAYAAVGLGGGRLALEMLRDPAAADPFCGGLRVAQVGALIMTSVGAVAAIRLRRAPA